MGRYVIDGKVGVLFGASLLLISISLAALWLAVIAMITTSIIN